MDFRPALVVCCLALFSPSAWPEVRVKITPPGFVEVGTVIEDLVSQQEINALISDPLGVFEAEGRTQIVGALNKPGLYSGMADAATLPLLSAARPLWDSGRLSLVLGMVAAVQTDTFDPAILGDRMKTLRPEIDYRLGAAAHPLTVTASWTPVPGELAWSVASFGAYSKVAYAPVGLTTAAAGASVQLRWAPGARWGPLSWEGITLTGAGGWASNRYDTELVYALPAQVVRLDLTYIDAGNVIITTTPKFQLTLLNEGTFWPLQLSTELALGRTLRLGLAAGVVHAQGTSSLSIEGTNAIHIESENEDPQAQIYEKFLGDTGWFTVSGRLRGSVGPWWQQFVTLTPSWSVGAFRFGLPLTYRFPGGVSVALAWGSVL